MLHILNTLPLICSAGQTPVYYDPVTMQTTTEAVIHVVNGIEIASKVVMCMM